MADETRAFREKLKELTELAKKNGMRLTVRQVQDALKEENLPEQKMQLVYAYLDQMSIAVTDPDLGEEGASAPGRRRSLEVYLEELDAIALPDEKLELELFTLASEGDEGARGRLIERYLATVCDLAGEFEDTCAKVETEDLIQEANMGLIMAVSRLEKEDSLAAYRVKLLNFVTQYLEERVKELDEMMNSDTRVVNRMNTLADAVHQLEEELEHKPSVEELSAFLDIPTEDILDLLRVGGESLKIDDM